MKLKWNKGLLFPYLMLIGSFSINVNTVQTENSNQLVLLNNIIEDQDNKVPVEEKQANINLSLNQNLNNYQVKTESHSQSISISKSNSNLVFLTLGLFVILLTFSLLRSKSHKINLNSLLKLKQHFNYLSYWDFQKHLYHLNNHKYQQINIGFLEQWKTNNPSLQVSSIHNITSA